MEKGDILSITPFSNQEQYNDRQNLIEGENYNLNRHLKNNICQS